MSIIPHTFEIALHDGKRDSRIPGGPPGLDGTTLQTLAQALTPGRIVLLAPNLPPMFEGSYGLYRRYRPDGEYLAGDDATWGAKSLWDRVRKTSWTIAERSGSGRPPSWNARGYRASDHACFHGSFDLVPDMTHAHTYGGQAIDDSRGYLYYRCTSTLIRRYDVNAQAWEQIALTDAGVSVGGTGGQTYHEGLDGLMCLGSQSGTLGVGIWRDGDSSWSFLAATGHHSHHTNFAYNRVRGDALILGGNTNPAQVTLINPDGSATSMQDRPDSVGGVQLLFGMQSRHLTHDPISGNYLMFDRDDKKVVWEYSPDLDEWRIGKNWGTTDTADWPGPYYGHPIVPVDELGVILWFTSYAPRIYKHVSVF